jgi:hypothetical protein
MDFLTIPASASNGRRVPQLAAMVAIGDFRRSSHGTPASITETPKLIEQLQADRCVTAAMR